MHLGLVINDVNMYKLSMSIWSTWHVMLLNYNIPLWLTTKKFFVMFALLIPGKESVILNFFDVDLQPIVEKVH
jgi:hypothetical protein